MKTLAPALLSHLQQEVTTLAYLLRLTRVDGAVYGFTTLDYDFAVGSTTYRATEGLSPTAVSQNSGLEVNNLQIELFLTDIGITDNDVQVGKFDAARWDLFIFNWQDLPTAIPSDKALQIGGGYVGEGQQTERLSVTYDLRGLTQQLSNNIGEVTSPTCRYNLGDVRCTVNLPVLTYHNAEVTTLVDDRTFRASQLEYSDDNYWAGGKVTFKTGDNAGFSIECAFNDNGQIELVAPPPYPFTISDTFDITPGCDKNRYTCAGKFNNAINFGGEPDIPGNDQLIAGYTGGTPSGGSSGGGGSGGTGGGGSGGGGGPTTLAPMVTALDTTIVSSNDTVTATGSHFTGVVKVEQVNTDNPSQRSSCPYSFISDTSLSFTFNGGLAYSTWYCVVTTNGGSNSTSPIMQVPADG
ncbi:DUF2163 domain-containing protein [Gloeobacter kilaueensis]|uniref:Bacteriophage phiJL001 Gp84 C-terminal domain-containing protein n=1 Tax=Gloeobacter kilaueensis (strain ATCC BAA-2537 / CCAP 1431/1 / ULC 316 / JS1) TaxID=1183438 RepID=U5QE08_GLOK1|nr:DUF2163 domain-containing protein [Gloeobacter kilaueensis]AGY57156.1 hypothetical protein GKIL_0910 [Gloeobacter kilaueensis JS1]